MSTNKVAGNSAELQAIEAEKPTNDAQKNGSFEVGQQVWSRSPDGVKFYGSIIEIDGDRYLAEFVRPERSRGWARANQLTAVRCPATLDDLTHDQESRFV